MQRCKENQPVCCWWHWTWLIISLWLLTVWPLTDQQSQEVFNYRSSRHDPVEHLWTGPLFLPMELTKLVTTFLSHNALLCSNGVNNKVRWSELMVIGSPDIGHSRLFALTLSTPLTCISVYSWHHCNGNSQNNP